MKILKIFLIVVVGIVVLVLVGLAFAPSHYTVTRTTEIAKPANVVYSQVSDYEKWGAWDAWREMEPEAKATVEGEPGKPGHKSTWEGQKLGKGAHTITQATENQSIDGDLEFIEPFTATAKDHWKFEETGGTTKVTWTTEGDLDYPSGRLFGLMMDKQLGGSMAHGLDNLKKVCEAIPTPEPVAAATDSVAAPAN